MTNIGREFLIVKSDFPGYLLNALVYALKRLEKCWCGGLVVVIKPDRFDWESGFKPVRFLIYINK